MKNLTRNTTNGKSNNLLHKTEANGLCKVPRCRRVSSPPKFEFARHRKLTVFAVRLNMEKNQDHGHEAIEAIALEKYFEIMGETPRRIWMGNEQ